MLKTIRLKNFKLHEDTSIEAAPITVFIGPNNSGKSSILQVLLCLRDASMRGGNGLLQSVGRQPTNDLQPFLYPAGRILDLGEFTNVVRSGHDQIDVAVAGVHDPHRSQKYEPRTEVEFEIRVKNNTLTYNYGTLRNDYGKVEWGWMQGMQGQPPMSNIEVDVLSISFAPQQNFQLLAAGGYLSAGGGLPVIAPQRMVEVLELQRYIASVPSRLLKSSHPIYALRGFEEWGCPLPERKPDSLDRLCLLDRGVALAGLLAYDRELEEELSQRLTDLLNLRIKVRLTEGKRLTIWGETPNKTSQDRVFLNEGTGASQLPHILVPIALAQPNEIILLSEPEAHLHPKAQSELTALLLTIAKKQNLQFFIETHSEHVLHKLLHSIGKGELTKEELALYYFVNEDGRAKATRLPINDLGQVEGGLPGFFEQSLTELTEYLDALRKP